MTIALRYLKKRILKTHFDKRIIMLRFYSKLWKIYDMKCNVQTISQEQ